MQQQLTTQLHTILMLVGPTRAGKSTLAAVVARELAAAHANVRVVSLDLDANPTVDAVAECFSQLRTLTTWPTNHEFIVLDGPALDPAFRAEVASLAAENGYNLDCLLLNFPHKHFFRGASTLEERERVKADLETFTRDVLPTLRQRDFSQLTRFRFRDSDHWAALAVDIEGLDEWENCQLRLLDRPVALFGDVHENVGAANRMLAALENSIPVLVGDWCDKGGDTLGAIELAERVLALGGRLVLGNHESYTHQRLHGAPGGAAPEVEAAYFTALPVLQADSALASRFEALYAQALPYLHVLDAEGRSIAYATHAPCLERYIGKHHAAGQRSQRNHRLPARSSEHINELLAPVLAQAREEAPVHAFGHVPHRSQVLRKNQAWLDTGASQGGKLTALVLHPTGRTEVIQVDGDSLFDGELYEIAPA